MRVGTMQGGNASLIGSVARQRRLLLPSFRRQAEGGVEAPRSALPNDLGSRYHPEVLSSHLHLLSQHLVISPVSYSFCPCKLPLSRFGGHYAAHQCQHPRARVTH